MALLNTQSFPAGYRRGSQIFKTQGGFDCCAGLQIDGLHGKDGGWPPGTENGFSMTVSGEIEISVL